MQSFAEYLIEKARERHHREKRGGSAIDEKVLASFGTFASKVLKGKITIEGMNALVEYAKTHSDSEISFKKTPIDFYANKQKTSDSKQSYHDMLDLCPETIMAFVKAHPDFAKDGFTCEWVGKKIYSMTDEWLRQGAKQGSVTGTSKTDVVFRNNKTGKTRRTSIKRGPAQGMSGQPAEALGVITRAAYQTLQSIAADRETNVDLYSKTFKRLAELNEILRSTKGIKSKDRRDKAIENVKPKITKIIDEFVKDKDFGVEFKKNLIAEALFGEGKFGAKSEGTPTDVLGMGVGRDAYIITKEQYIAGLTDEVVKATKIYWTLPKTEAGEYAVLRVEVPKNMVHDIKQKKKAEPESEPTPNPKAKPSSDKPRPTADFAGGGFDQEWAGPNDFSTRAVSTKRAKPGAGKPNGKSKGKSVSKPMANRKSIAKPTVSPHLAKPGLLNRIRGAFAGPQKDKRKIDWQNIETDFKTGRDRVEDIGTRYKVDPSTIYKAARLKKWARSKHMETI